MAPSRVIRVDEQVWAELQRRARPLEDTPNSVLRRVFGLEEAGAEPGGMDSRITILLELVHESVGQMPKLDPVRKGYSFLSNSGEVVAYIRPQKERLRIETSKRMAESASLTTWDRERPNGFFGGPCVRWYLPDGDGAAYQRAYEHGQHYVWLSDFHCRLLSVLMQNFSSAGPRIAILPLEHFLLSSGFPELVTLISVAVPLSQPRFIWYGHNLAWGQEGHIGRTPHFGKLAQMQGLRRGIGKTT